MFIAPRGSLPASTGTQEASHETDADYFAITSDSSDDMFSFEGHVVPS
jgi:hypothetical protein